jgi:hypothetical protein
MILRNVDELREELDAGIHLSEVATGTFMMAASTFSIGYVFWSIRTGFLITSVLTAMPAWQSFDPVPLLNTMEDDDSRESDDQTLESMVKTAALGQRRA